MPRKTSTEGKSMKLVKIFGRMQRWIDQGNHGITVGFLMHKFPVNSVGARWILNQFYEKHGRELDVHRGYFVIRHPPRGLVQEIPEREDVEITLSKSELRDAGVLVTEKELEEMKKSGDIYRAYLYSVHPAALDDSERFMDIEFDAIMRTKKKKTRNPLATLHPKGEDRSRLVKMESEVKKAETKKTKEAEAKKVKEAARIDALFAAAGTREKVVSPKGKKKDPTPVKSSQDFFKSSPKAKKVSETSEESSPLKKTAFKNLTMDDVFTTGEDEPDLIIDESVSHKSKSPESRYRPKKMSAKANSKTVHGEPSVVPMEVEEAEVEELDDQPGSSSSPAKVKRMQNVTDTYMADEDDEEGAFIVTEVSKKMVETDESAPPPSKKTRTKTAPPAKEKPSSKKGQSSLLNFFKKP
ncbi:hypothetical protein FO519_007570 [Halicephalobus sp. NKZ332]|nr:hypothetical protein FO519_007570 [Halicephalobus sp. NKZ332]